LLLTVKTRTVPSDKYLYIWAYRIVMTRRVTTSVILVIIFQLKLSYGFGFLVIVIVN